MTIVVPVPIPPAGLPLPDPGDRATFSARKLEQLRWANNEYSTGSLALADASYSNALDAQGSATSAADNAASAAANTALAALYAGAISWVSGTTYAIGDRRYSPANGLVYRRITAGAGTTDPSADPTNWQLVQVAPPVLIVSATSQTAVAGYEYVLTNVAATTVTLPASPVTGDLVIIKPANGLATNVVARNGNTIEGVAEDMTIDNAFAVVNLQYLNSSWRLV